jgi:hypothetical protein
MTAYYIPLILVAISITKTARAIDPDLERLKGSYAAAVAKATAPIQGTYEKELQKLLQAHTKAGRLDAAAEVMSELQSLGAVATAPSAAVPVGGSGATPNSNDRLFVGKSWYSKAGSEYHFNKDGTGYRLQKMDFDDKVTFTWRQLPDGVVEALQRKQPTAQATPTYFRFVDRKTAYQGDSASNITSPLTENK